MRKLPRKKTKRHNLIIRATEDFFGDGASGKEKKSIRKIALWLMKRRKGLEKLTEREKESLWFIKGNLADETYRESLLKNAS